MIVGWGIFGIMEISPGKPNEMVSPCGRCLQEKLEVTVTFLIYYYVFNRL